MLIFYNHAIPNLGETIPVPAQAHSYTHTEGSAISKSASPDPLSALYLEN